MKSTQDIAEALGITVAILRSWQINLNLEHPRYAPEDKVYDKPWIDYFTQVARLRRQGMSFRNIREELQGQQPSQVPQLPMSPSFSPPENLSQPPSHTLSAPSNLPVTASSQALVNQNTQPGTPSIQSLQNHMHEALLQQDLTKMAQTYVHLMENYQNLAGRFSENTYLLGQLEEKSSALETRLEEKEKHYREQELQHKAQSERLEAHIQSLQKALDHSDERFDTAQGHLQKKEADLSAHQEKLVTKTEIASVGDQLKEIQSALQQQQQLLASEQNKSFWQRLLGR
jgi:DNA-binding transcriptional MerR regulator